MVSDKNDVIIFLKTLLLVKENSCKTVLLTSTGGRKVMVGGRRLPQLPHHTVARRAPSQAMVILKCQSRRERERYQPMMLLRKGKKHKEGKTKTWLELSLCERRTGVDVLQFISSADSSALDMKCEGQMYYWPGLGLARPRCELRVLIFSDSHSWHLAGFLTNRTIITAVLQPTKMIPW